MVYPYNGIFFKNKKDWTIDTYYNMNESWEHYSKWKMSDTKGHIFYGFIYMKYPEWINR